VERDKGGGRERERARERVSERERGEERGRERQGGRGRWVSIRGIEREERVIGRVSIRNTHSYMFSR
jgi:hypothetical protein